MEQLFAQIRWSRRLILAGQVSAWVSFGCWSALCVIEHWR